MITEEPVTPGHGSDKTMPSPRLSPRALAALGVDGRHDEARDDFDETTGDDGDDEIDVDDDLPPLEHATGDTGDTGNTSRTMFVGEALEEARRRSGEAVEGDDDDVRRTPRWLTRGLPALLLLGLIGISALKLIDLETARTQPDKPAQKTTKEAPAGAGIPKDPAESRLAKELPPRGFAIRELLALELEAIRPDRSSEYVRLRDVARRRRVTLINIWATFCSFGSSSAIGDCSSFCRTSSTRASLSGSMKLRPSTASRSSGTTIAGSK